MYDILVISTLMYDILVAMSSLVYDILVVTS